MKLKMCECGCGGIAPLSDRTETKRGYIKGQPMRFIKNHHPKKENSRRWKGGRRNHSSGYIEVMVNNHPRANSSGYVLEHIIIAEKAIGHYLPINACIHHVDKNGRNNENANLVVCNDDAYHKLIHERQKAIAACGNPYWKRCIICKQYSDPNNMNSQKNGNSCLYYHKECQTKKLAIYRSKRIIPDNVEIECACGCGQRLMLYDSLRRKRRFIQHHNTTTSGTGGQSGMPAGGGMPPVPSGDEESDIPF